MTRVLPVLLVLLALAPLRAEARGGRLDDVPRPPPGREMSPFPPPPPPPQPLPVPAPDGRVPAPPATSPARRHVPASYEDWTWWYAHERERFEAVKQRVLRDHGSRPLFVSDEKPPQKGPPLRLLDWVRRERIVPALQRHLATGRDDVRAAACVALGKTADDVESVALLRRALDPATESSERVHESAAIGLGLLRRTLFELPAPLLDAVREQLFAAVEDATRPDRTRAVAALSLGLLGDQPTEVGDRATTARLFRNLEATADRHPDLQVGLLLAVGRQPAASVSEAERAELARGASKGRLGGAMLAGPARAIAVETLARVGTEEAVPVLEAILGTRRGVGHDERRSAALALGTLGRRLGGEARAACAEAARTGTAKSRDPSTRAFALLSLGELLAADVADGGRYVLEGTSSLEHLLATASEGRCVERPFAALALGIVAGAAGEDEEDEQAQHARERALSLLREGLLDPELPPRSRAAFAVALGIAKDASSLAPLRALLANPYEDAELRAYAAEGLGVLDMPTLRTLASLADSAMAESSTPLHRNAVIALAGGIQIPGHGKTIEELLLDLLAKTPDAEARRRLVLLLGQVGHYRAAAPLLAILDEEEADPALRAQAAAALGQIGDLEWRTASLDRLRHGRNPRVGSDLLIWLDDLL